MTSSITLLTPMLTNAQPWK